MCWHCKCHAITCISEILYILKRSWSIYFSSHWFLLIFLSTLVPCAKLHFLMCQSFFFCGNCKYGLSAKLHFLMSVFFFCGNYKYGFTQICLPYICRDMYNEWTIELKAMADRIISMRHELFEALKARGGCFFEVLYLLNWTCSAMSIYCCLAEYP